jgi:hypothetical protein
MHFLLRRHTTTDFWRPRVRKCVSHSRSATQNRRRRRRRRRSHSRAWRVRSDSSTHRCHCRRHAPLVVSTAALMAVLMVAVAVVSLVVVHLMCLRQRRRRTASARVWLSAPLPSHASLASVDARSLDLKVRVRGLLLFVSFVPRSPSYHIFPFK